MSKKKTKSTTNSREYNVSRKREVLEETHSCTLCPLRGGENAGRRGVGKHGKTKPKYKQKRK